MWLLFYRDLVFISIHATHTHHSIVNPSPSDINVLFFPGKGITSWSFPSNPNLWVTVYSSVPLILFSQPPHPTCQILGLLLCHVSFTSIPPFLYYQSSGFIEPTPDLSPCFWSLYFKPFSALWPVCCSGFFAQKCLVTYLPLSTGQGPPPSSENTECWKLSTVTSFGTSFSSLLVDWILFRTSGIAKDFQNPPPPTVPYIFNFPRNSVT